MGYMVHLLYTLFSGGGIVFSNTIYFFFLTADKVMKSQVPKMDSSKQTFCMLELPNRNKQNVSPVRRKELSACLSSQYLDEKQVRATRHIRL